MSQELVQVVDLVMADFIDMEATFKFRGRFMCVVKGPYALIPLDEAGASNADPAPVDEFLEHLKTFIGQVQRHKDPRQAASMATAVLASWMAHPNDPEGA